MNPLENPTTNPFVIAHEAARTIQSITQTPKHDIAVTLGSGWGKAAELIGETTHIIPANEIIGFNSSKVPGHNSNIKSVLTPDGKRILIIGARTHFYESHNPYQVRQVVHSVRTAAAAGCKTMILTNGAGGINPNFIPGTVVAIKDHINLSGTSPIEGANFVDLTNLYTPKYRKLVQKLYPETPEGVYVQFRGPHYETPSEVLMARTIGGDIAGMSTALEAIAACEAGMDVLAMSLITNAAAGTIPNQSLNHEEVIAQGKASENQLAEMLATVVSTL